MKKLIALMMAALMLACAAHAEEDGLAGGWTPSAFPEITEEKQALFDEGMAGLLGVHYVPVAYLGSQVVAGANHCFLAQATAVAPHAQPTYVLIYLYESLNGDVEILDIADLDIGAFCTYGAK